MKKRIWKPLVIGVSMLMTVVLVFGALANCKLEAEAADTFLGIQNLITEVEKNYTESQKKYTVLEIVPDRSASEIGYLFDGYEPALSVWDETDKRWKGWKEQLGECINAEERYALIEGDTEDAGLKAKLQAYYAAQGIDEGPVSCFDEEYEESDTANDGYELIEFTGNKKTGWFEPLNTEGPGYNLVFKKEVYASDTKEQRVYYDIAEYELITNENKADFSDDDIVYIRNLETEGVAYYAFYWSDVKERYDGDNQPECYALTFARLSDSLRDGMFVYTVEKITRSDNAEYVFTEKSIAEGGQWYVLGEEGIYVKNTFANNNWFHKYVLNMTPEEYGSFPVEVLSYTPGELDAALDTGSFPEFDFLYINSGKSTDDKATDDYDAWVYSSAFDADSKNGGDISRKVWEELFARAQNNALPCVVDGNIIFVQEAQDDSGSVLKNEDLMEDASEIFKLCVALCQDTLDGMDYATASADMDSLWDGLATGMENGHFTTDHVYCHTGEGSIINDGFGTELIHTGEGTAPSGFGKVLDEIELENLFRRSDSSGEYLPLSTEITQAITMRHIVNYQNRRDIQSKEYISVLEIQPAKTKDGEPELTVEQIRKWAPEVEDAEITVMTTAEFIGKIETLNDKYDLIYIGTNKDHMNTEEALTETRKVPGNTDFNDDNMDGLIYFHVGDMRYAGMELAGQLDTEYLNGDRSENVFFYNPVRYSGNDITKDKMNALFSYLNGSYPVIVSDDFFESPVTVYYHADYDGYSFDFDEGDYDLDDMEEHGLPNDDASSVKVRQGYRLYLYDDHHFSGTYKIWEAIDEDMNIPSLRLAGFKNDALSSLKVEAIEGVSPKRVISKDRIDDSSYMYEFADTALTKGYGNFYKFSDIEENSELFQYYLNRPKVKLVNTYANGDMNNSKEIYYIDEENGRYNLEYHFTIENQGAASADTRYQCKLYIDVNADGKYSSQEMLDDIAITHNGNAVSTDQLYGGNEYVLKRVVPDGYKGVLPWKVEVSQINNANIYCCMEGYTKLNGLEKETINIIQISRDQILYGQYEWPNPDEEFFSLAEEINGKGTIYEELETTTVREDGKWVEHVTKSWAYSADTQTISQRELEKNLYYILVHGGTYNGVKYDGIDKEFDIDVDFYTISKFEDELRKGNIDMDDYNMLIMGFTDIYGEFSGSADNPKEPMGAIVDFINSGKSVLMSHDNTSFFNYEKGKKGIVDRTDPEDKDSLATDGQFHNAYTMNKYIRGLVGMDRYGILEPGISNILKAGKALTDETDAWDKVTSSGKDMAYKPKSGRTETVPEVQGYTYSIINARDKNERVEDKEEAKIYTKEETGLNSEWTNEYLNTVYGKVYYADEGDSNVPDWVVPSDEGGEVPEGYDGAVYDLYVTQVNQGQITQYPYKLLETFPVSATHAQYYQLDFTADDDKDGQSDMVVWYCLGPRYSQKNKKFQETIYSASPNDVANNYYIYTKGNITYSGVGHAGTESADMVEEAKLFINTMIAAYNAGTKPPIITIQEDAYKDSSELKVLYRYFDDDYALDTVNAGDDTYENIYFSVRDDNFVKGTRQLTIRAYYSSEDGDKTITNSGIRVKELERNGKVFNAATGQQANPDSLQSGGIYYIRVPKSVLSECDDSGMQIYLETQSIITSNNKVIETDKIYAKLDVMKVYLFDLN